MCLYPGISISAFGYASRNAARAGRVRMKSPIAPPRTTRMRFNAPRLILRKRAGEDRNPVDGCDTVHRAPAHVAPRAPIDLVAQQVWHRHPKEAGNDEQVGEHRQEQAAGFVTEECRLQ